ncbi:MAG: sensor histidine kinase [Bacillota bacterium]
MAATVHDLRNPLTVVKGISRRRIKKASEKDQGYFQQIIAQVDVMLEMLNEILGTIDVEEFMICSPATVVKEIMTEIQPLCDECGIELTFVTQGQFRFMVKSRLFKRAIHNLLMNAIQVMECGDRLSVNVNSKKESVTITIEDTGPGIPEEIQKDIFSPFVRGLKKNSTGLGLYSVYHAIAEVHKGKIHYETEMGRGTTFFVDLPSQI